LFIDVGKEGHTLGEAGITYLHYTFFTLINLLYKRKNLLVKTKTGCECFNGRVRFLAIKRCEIW